MKNWKPSDIIMLILVSTVAFAITSIFIEAAFTDVPMSDHSAKLVAGLIGSIISIISMYIGAKIQQNKDK